MGNLDDRDKFTRKTWSAHAASIKENIYALYFAARDPRVPPTAKLVIAGIVAYALSPIDLIPDFIPVLGLLDDVILLPFAIRLAIKMIPGDVWDDCRVRANAAISGGLPRSWIAFWAIVGIWLGVAALAIFFGRRWYAHSN